MHRNNAHDRPGTSHSAATETPPSNPQANPCGPFPVASHLHERAVAEVLRVLLVEDSPLLVQRISELVAELPGVQITGTAASEAEALKWLEKDDIDAVILDLQLHTGSGFGILRALHRRSPSPRVVVFTNFAINAYRDTALALGATHFLDKSRDYDRLPKVLQELSDTRH